MSTALTLCHREHDGHEDFAKIPMQLGELPSPESQFSVYFAHVAPDQCSMRLDLDKARAWVVIQEKKQPQRCGQPVACSVYLRASGLAHSLLQPACRR
ncbi:MAG: hypothetical protein ABSD63_06015 [Candidatus Korobacteraceae bacterium]|jgi:hypothetical protein